MYALLTSLQSAVADRFGSKDRGATAVEYGLLVGLIAVVIIAAVVFLGGSLTDIFAGVGNEVDDNTAGLDTTIPEGDTE